MEFWHFLLSGMAEYLAVCYFAPDIPKQLSQEHPKHALYMINLVKSHGHFVDVVCTWSVIYNTVHARGGLENRVGIWHPSQKWRTCSVRTSFM